MSGMTGLLLCGLVAAQPDVTRLRADLDNPDLEVRRAAVVRLGRLGPAAAAEVQGLANALATPELQPAAALALERIGAAAVPVLRNALSSESAALREDAA